MPIFKRKSTKKSRDAPSTAYLIRDTSGAASIFPPGYTSLSSCEEVQKCKNIIADCVSNMTIMLMANGEYGDQRIRNELSKKIDIYPNPLMTRKRFIARIVADLCDTGNAFVYPKIGASADNFGYIEELQIMPASQVTFLNQTVNSYQIMYKGNVFEPDEILHFAINPNPNYPYMGDGFAPAVKKTVQNLLQEQATKKAFLQSKWRPSLIISIQTDIEELQDKEQRAKILDSYTSTTDEGEPWLIPAGEIDVKTINPLTLNDLAIQDGIQLDIKSVGAAYRIPPFMLGVGEFNVDEYNNFISTEIMSISTELQQEMTRKLLYSPSMYFKFSPKSLMQYNLPDKVGFVKELVNSAMMTRNEGRSEFDLSPADAEGMNDFQMLENYIPIGKLGLQKKLNGGDE